MHSSITFVTRKILSYPGLIIFLVYYVVLIDFAVISILIFYVVAQTVRYNVYFKIGAVDKKKKKKTEQPINFNTNYRGEMKLIPINMDYCLLQFDALKFFLWVCLQRGSLSSVNFSMYTHNLTTKS